MRDLMNVRHWRASYDMLGRLVYHVFRHGVLYGTITIPHLAGGGRVCKTTILLPIAIYSRPPARMIEIPVWPDLPANLKR